MKTKLTLFLSLFILALGLAAPYASASIPDRARSIDLKVVPIYSVRKPLINKEVINQYFPPLTPTNNEKVVALQFRDGVGQKVLENLVNGEYFKQTPIGKIATQIQSVTQTTLVLSKPAKSEPEPEKNSDFVDSQESSATDQTAPAETQANANDIIHTINFNIRALEHRAILTYTGWLSSNLTYTMDDKSLLTEISKPITQSTTLSLSNKSVVGQFLPEGTLYITYIF
ncbi:MAG: hypothetical protein SGI74_11615 [Oligoflexia bacterium]|nr:hypothetical protein [Oligoflexia bacterium]